MDPIGPDNPSIFPDDYCSQRAREEHFLNDYPFRAYDASRRLYEFGRHLNAVMACKYGLMHDPSELRLHFTLMMIYRSLNREKEARRQWEIIQRLRLSPEMAQVLQEKIDRWIHVPDSVGDLPVSYRNTQPHFTTSLLGIEGRFGNSVFQYAFGRLYAEKHGMRYEAYDWIGRRLFGLRDPMVSKILPFILEIEYLREDMFSVPPLEAGLCDRDAQGYFQFHTRYYAPYKRSFISFFKPVSMVEWLLQAFLQEIRKRGKTLVAIHLRRGDSDTQGRMSDTRLYVDWLRELWPTLEAPVLFLASDDIEGVRRDLEEFHPVTAEQVRLPIPGAGFYPDFYMLTQADYLAAGNSTFSLAASMLNEVAKAVLRPNPENTRLVPYDPWSVG